MINTKTKHCKNPECSNTFTPYRSTDKYCSYSCSKACEKPKERKQAKRIPQATKKRAAELRIYEQLKKVFLAKPENKYCPVMKHLKKGDVLTDQVHHKAGRKGKLLNYVPFWLACSDYGHKWIHANPEKAYELGFLLHSSHKYDI